MGKKKEETYGFLADLVVYLMNMDKLFTYVFLQHELHVSSRKVNKMRQGKSVNVYQYVRLIRCILKYMNFRVRPDVLLKVIKICMTSHSDLVIATVPRGSDGKVQPEKWEVIMECDGVIL
ncbi:hypothetical protein [uncultured Bacteroides sp.]|uniref:hypothetical protein n=1 Tax=uncultured Bacteroides sp. TaxID=162156 RepID=UPI0025E0A9C9|nr:hypothetical protein [uncultured Bacteroides sp.]